MNWEALLSLRRHGDTTKRIRKEQDEIRLGFEVDYDRIVFSSYFRSLQDKTQVIPFSKTDFVHTRLTHSLEVSVVARSLGRLAGKELLKRHPHLQEIHGYQPNDFGAIVAAAALAHDIGNPPFGHSGEKAIGHYFESGEGKQFQAQLTKEEYEDLCRFEGNANGFKLLTESMEGTPGGLRLSYATLGAYMKYPKGSLPRKPTAHVADKKFGYFQSEKKFFAEIAREMELTKGTGNNRHPLAFLVEAADDICYTIIDFEDAINLGNIAEDHALEQLINLVRHNIKTETYSILSTTSERLAYLRSLAIGTLIKDCVEKFMDHEQEILAGTLSTSLTDLSSFKPQIDDILALTIENLYRHPDVVHKEIAGYKILKEVLDAIITASVNDLNGQDNSYDRLILQLLPRELLVSSDLYDRLLASCGFVASLTDTKAVELFEIINGRT